MDDVRRFAHKVGTRLGVQALLDAASGWLCLGLGAAAAAVLAERLLALGVPVPLLVAAGLLAASFAGVVAGVSRWPTLQRAALAADARFALDERVSSALAVAAGPMTGLLQADAVRHTQPIALRRALPIAPPPSVRALALLAVALAAAAFVPPLDLLGWGAARAARATELADVRRATEAVRLSLGKLAAAGRNEGLPRTEQQLNQIDQRLAGVAASETTASQAREAAKRMLDELDKARAASEAAAKAAADPTQRAKAEAERDLLLSSARVIEGWQRELAGEARGGTRPQPGKAPDSKKGVEGTGEKASEFVRPAEAPSVPREAMKVEARLIEARPAAEAAVRRDDVPWQYRSVVRLYFSPTTEPERLPRR